MMFHYAPGRGGEHAVRFLEGYRGRFLQCDGYVAYDAPAALARPEGPWQLVHCWTHVRRRFVKRLENDGSPIAEQALRQIAELYAIEASVRGHAPEARLAARTKLAAPIIAAFSSRRLRAYRPLIAATNSLRVSMLTHPIPLSPPTTSRGAFQVRQRLNIREHSWRGNAGKARQSG